MGKLADKCEQYLKKVGRSDNTAETAERAFYMGACVALLAKTQKERDSMLNDFNEYHKKVLLTVKGGM